MRKSWFIIGLFIVIFISFFVRFYRLSEFPISLSIDEVNIGHNAYSILKTGADEWGKAWPLAFKSVGDYKPPVNVYLTVPSIAIFGLNEFAVRFPSAFLGSLTSLVLILLLLELGFSKKSALITGFWLAILPWHIHFSRASFEAITGLFLTIFAVWLFLKWKNSQKFIYLFGSIVGFSLAVWAYHAQRAFVPLLFIFLLWLFRDSLKTNRKIKSQLLLTIPVLVLFAAPFLKLTFFTPAVKQRAMATSIMRESSLVKAIHHGQYSNLKELIFDNDFYLILRHWAGKYLNYFDPQFIFLSGMELTPKGYPSFGLLYGFDLAIFALGIWFLLKSKNKKLKQLASFWFFAGPIPASLTMNEQHPLRALVWLPSFAIILGAGFELVFAWLKELKAKLVFIAGYLLLIAVSLIYFYDLYFYQFPKFHSEFWQYGFKDIAVYACEHKQQYDNVIISETFGSFGPTITGIPYSYVLFYCQYDPAKFVADGRKIDNFIFRRVDWLHDQNRPNDLLIASPWDFPPDGPPKEKVVKEIKFLNGRTGFYFVESGD